MKLSKKIISTLVVGSLGLCATSSAIAADSYGALTNSALGQAAALVTQSNGSIEAYITAVEGVQKSTDGVGAMDAGTITYGAGTIVLAHTADATTPTITATFTTTGDVLAAAVVTFTGVATVGTVNSWTCAITTAPTAALLGLEFTEAVTTSTTAAAVLGLSTGILSTCGV